MSTIKVALVDDSLESVSIFIPSRDAENLLKIETIRNFRESEIIECIDLNDNLGEIAIAGSHSTLIIYDINQGFPRKILTGQVKFKFLIICLNIKK